MTGIGRVDRQLRALSGYTHCFEAVTHETPGLALAYFFDPYGCSCPHKQDILGSTFIANERRNMVLARERPAVPS